MVHANPRTRPAIDPTIPPLSEIARRIIPTVAEINAYMKMEPIRLIEALNPSANVACLPAKISFAQCTNPVLKKITTK
jgi:hypothetical protein